MAPGPMLRIVSTASSVQELVQLYSRLCDRDSIYVVTRDAPAPGRIARFQLTLADGQPVLSGTGQVTEVHHSKDNPHGHPGMKLCFDQVDPQCTAVLERLITSGSSGSGLTLIGELNAGSIESIVQCTVFDEPDPPEARPQTPPPAHSSMPSIPPSMPGMPAGHAAQVIAPPDMPMAAQVGLSARDTTPLPLSTPPPSTLHPTTPFPSSPASAPAAVPAFAGPFADSSRRHIEPTQLVRPLKRPVNRKAIIISAVAAVVIAMAGGYLLWGRSDSSPASAGSPSAHGDAGPDATGADDCKVSIVTTPEGATVRAGERELGVTPLDTALPCGAAALEIERSRYRPVHHEIELARDRDNKVEITLDRPGAELEVVSRPDGATVFIDGKKVGKTPVTVQVDAYSQLSVVVRKSRYHSFRKRVSPTPPRHTVEARLKKRR